jgi:hypothetical protein
MLDLYVNQRIHEMARELENKLEGSVIYYYGPIFESFVKFFRNNIEEISKRNNGKLQKICIFIKTTGGQVEAVEKMVDIVRHHYKEVWFFVPDYAMSAGTIFCLSGDKIFMDYSSSLGPIDPQVQIMQDGRTVWVPALGALEQFERLIEKSFNGNLSPAEFALLQNQNLAVLSSYEHARDLSIDLAKEWLVQYKFKNWNKHRTDKNKKNQNVTYDEKLQRASEIVGNLADHKLWHSHGRFISANMLRDKLKIEIDDYPKDVVSLIRDYNDLLTDYLEQKNYNIFIHNCHMN